MLTPVEEAQLRDLIAQQSALLSLAGVEATILSKLGATKVTLSDLPSASVIDDADLLLLRQGVTDKSVTGLILEQYLAAELGDTFVNVAGDTMSGALALFGGDTGVTPAQFYNDTSLATTAFVQRALGNLQGEQAYVTSQAITAAQVGKLINFSGAGVTLTLPNSANVPVGSVLTIYGNGFGGAIQKAAGDILLNGTFGSISSFNLVAHDKVNLVSIGAAGWYVIGGEVGLRSSSSFAASLASSGYQKLPSGLILQWGSLPSTADDGTASITWPISFPNNCYMAVASADTFNTSYQLWALTAKTTTTGTFRQMANGSASGGYYISIGN